MTKGSILLVEDDDLVRQAVHSALERNGYHVWQAGTCASGLDIAVQERLDILVLDIGLPDGTGWTLLERIRLYHPAFSTPIIVISSNRVPRSLLRENRVDRFIPKPFNMPDLVEAVQELMASGLSPKNNQ